MLDSLPTSKHPLRILLATSNRHKLREMRQLLAPAKVELLGADDVGGLPSVLEDGETFADNAIKKALAAARHTTYPVLADDSGFAVFALNGAPGVKSARYAGDGASDQDNVDKLLAEMEGRTERRACFVCVLALAFGRRLIGTVEGRVEGGVVEQPRGSRGFGYDPVFQPDGKKRTFAEMPAAAKNRISHRARAAQALVESGLLQGLRQNRE